MSYVQDGLLRAREARMNSAPRLIGFAGRKRSGKDTAAQALVEMRYERLAFATPLKQMLRAMLRAQGVGHVTIERMLEGDLKETPTEYLGGQTPRHAMQTLGTQWGRELICDTIWVDATMRLAATIRRVVITDVRFPNEVAAIKAAGGIVVRVDRPGLPPADDHASEAQIDVLEVDHVIHNTSDIKQLHDMVRGLVR